MSGKSPAERIAELGAALRDVELQIAANKAQQDALQDQENLLQARLEELAQQIEQAVLDLRGIEKAERLPGPSTEIMTHVVPWTPSASWTPDYVFPLGTSTVSLPKRRLFSAEVDHPGRGRHADTSTLVLLLYLSQTPHPTHRAMVKAISDKDTPEARNRLHSRLSYLQNRGLVEQKDDQWHLTQSGWLVVRELKSELAKKSETALHEATKKSIAKKSEDGSGAGGSSAGGRC